MKYVYLHISYEIRIYEICNMKYVICFNQKRINVYSFQDIRMLSPVKYILNIAAHANNTQYINI